MSGLNGSTSSWHDKPARKGTVGLVLASLVVLGVVAIIFVVNPYLALVPLGLLCLVLLHWLLWGKRLTKELQEERQRLLDQERTHEQTTSQPAPWERRY